MSAAGRGAWRGVIGRLAALGPAARVLLVLAAGAIGLMLLLVLRPRPEQARPEHRPPLVTTVPAEVRSGHLTVRGTGTVRASRRVALAPQVGGRVVWTSPALVSGGRFRAGDALLRIEAADYENAVAVAEADVAAARVDVLQWEEERELAREEFERLRRREGIAAPADSGPGGRLVFREPQLAAARASLRRAEARLADARLALARTRLAAPFDGLVLDETVDIGQFVQAGAAVATIVGTDAVEIVVALTDEEAGLVAGLWDARAGADGAGRPDGTGDRIPVRVRATVAGRPWTWEGHVDRVEGALNPETRTVDVVVRVPDPFTPGPDGRPPLVLGSFAEADIRGAFRERYVALPRPALRDGEAVWVVEDGGVLRIVPATLLQQVEGRVFLEADVAAGAPVIVSGVAAVTDGMAVRPEPAGDRPLESAPASAPAGAAPPADEGAAPPAEPRR
ncbi:MAG: efflux RND transporter periplasmic adaptor subunit [Gemmatimonadota bacterium]|nr:efflux RND transporter periplasmic adaptor subunit [Gemmatimonadota bacterium]